MPASRRMSAAFGSSRPSPMRITSARCSRVDNAALPPHQARGLPADGGQHVAQLSVGMRLTQMVVMIAGSWFVLRGELSNGGFVSFLLLVGVFFRPVEKINSVIETYPKGIAGFRRYTELLDTRAGHRRPARRRRGPGAGGNIRYENVSFGYRAAASRCCGTSTLTISAGETVAFVGPSGAGKTTICSLLPRFYEVDGGRDHHRWHRHPRHDAGLAARPDRHRPAGCLPVRRHDPREHRLWPARTPREAEILEAARRARLDE